MDTNIFSIIPLNHFFILLCKNLRKKERKDIKWRERVVPLCGKFDGGWIEWKLVTKKSEKRVLRRRLSKRDDLELW